MPERARSPESRDVSARGLVMFAGGFAVFIAVTLGGLALLFDTAGIWPESDAANIANRARPALQRTPKRDLAAFEAREERELETLGWTDRDANVARIPVEDAIRIIAKRGLPDWGARTPEANGACGLLENAVPRAPQAARCRTSPLKGDEQ